MIRLVKNDAIKVSKTYGFHLFEWCFRKYESWPTSNGIRGLGGIIFVSINLVWTTYPVIMEFSNYKITFNECLLRLQFLTTGLSFLIINALFLHRGNHLFKLIDVLSDFDKFGYPKGLEFVEKTIRLLLKIINYTGFANISLISYGILFDGKFCTNLKWFANERGITCDLMIAYYLPFNLKSWHQALLVLLQMYSFTRIENIFLYMWLLYCYMTELLILRLDQLTLSIENIHFIRSQTDNIKLKKVIMYYQDIFQLFQMTNNFMRALILGPKLCTVAGAILSATGFSLRPNLSNFMILIGTLPLLYFTHRTGQRLIDAGDNVAKAVYNLNWYDADISIQKTILTFLAICQRRFTTELPLFGNLSHWQLGNECKKIYVWVNWILKISRNKSFN